MKQGLFAVALVALGTVVACDENPEEKYRYGSVELTTTAPTAEAPITTPDGWTITPTKLLANISAVTIAGTDGVVTASATAQVFDLVKPGAKQLVLSTVRYARAWEDVSLQIGPATAASVAVDVEEADLTGMVTGGFSIYLEASATKADVTKTLRWGFTTDTVYGGCEGQVGNATVKGLLVPANGIDSANVVLRGDVFFSDKVDGTGPLTFEAIALADANTNGEVTLDELIAVPLETARAGGALYDVGEDETVTDLGGFVAALSRRLVGSFRAAGTCTPEDPPAEP